jgi:ATP-dependent DNA helicase Rep
VIVDFLGYLRLIINEDDDLAFKRIINIPRRSIGPKKLAALIEHCEKHTVTLLKGCNEFRFLHHWDQKTAVDFAHFHKMIMTFQKRSRSESHLKWIDDLVAEIDYFGWIEQTTPHAKTAQQQIKMVKDFIRWIQASHKKTPDLEEILRKILLMDRLEQKSQHETNITLATIHAVKGLEFDEVYIFGCNEGVLPHKESGENVEEERRLLYVAMTRAKKRLVLSHSSGEGVSTGLGKSRFLAEIGDEFLRPLGGSGPGSWEEMRQLLGM